MFDTQITTNSVNNFLYSSVNANLRRSPPAVILAYSPLSSITSKATKSWEEPLAPRGSCSKIVQKPMVAYPWINHKFKANFRTVCLCI